MYMYMYIGTFNKEQGEHNSNNLSTWQWTCFKVPNFYFPILLIHLEPLKSRQPLHNVSFVQGLHFISYIISAE